MRQFLWVFVVAAAAVVLGWGGWLAREVQRTYDEKIESLEAAVAVTYSATMEQRLVEERVLDLPEDGNQWHTILILRPNWQSHPTDRRAEALFHADPTLTSLKHQTHWHLITTDQPEFAKFRALVDATPCLIVERANGEVVYRESGPNLGRHGPALARSIRREIERHCPDGRCLPLHPVPNEPDRSGRDEIPSVLREESPPVKKRDNPFPLVAAGLMGGLLGFATKFRRAAGM